MEGIDHVVFGHTPLVSPAHVVNRVYIDTGGGYPGGEPTLLELEEMVSRGIASAPEPFLDNS